MRVALCGGSHNWPINLTSVRVESKWPIRCFVFAASIQVECALVVDAAAAAACCAGGRCCSGTFVAIIRNRPDAVYTSSTGTSSEHCRDEQQPAQHWRSRCRRRRRPRADCSRSVLVWQPNWRQANKLLRPGHSPGQQQQQQHIPSSHSDARAAPLIVPR